MNKQPIDKIIIKTVCSFYGISESDLKSKSKKGHLPDARAIAAMLLKKYYTVNQYEISRMLGQSKNWFANIIPRAESRKDSRFNNSILYCITKTSQTLESAEKSIGLENKIIVYYTEIQVKKAVCDKYEISSDDLMGKSKVGVLEYARPMYALLLYSHVTQHKGLVSRAMGRKSHASAVEFINRAEDLISTNTAFKTHLQQIRQKLSDK